MAARGTVRVLIVIKCALGSLVGSVATNRVFDLPEFGGAVGRCKQSLLAAIG